MSSARNNKMRGGRPSYRRPYPANNAVPRSASNGGTQNGFRRDRERQRLPMLCVCVTLACVTLLAIAIIGVIILFSVFGRVQNDMSPLTTNPPGCSLQCQFGIPNELCDDCVCEFGILIGHVADTSQRPLYGATISDAEKANTILATTDISGDFRGNGVCPVVRNMVIRREGYITAVGQTVTQSSTTARLDVALEMQEHPYFVEHPENKLRVVGDSVALCCKANGNPPSKIQWFKDKSSIAATDDTLLLTSLSMADAGMYKCRAENTVGAVFSNSAELAISDGFETCNRRPVDNIIDLPPTCIQPETNSATYNQGICKPYLCISAYTQTQCHDQVCCQTDEQEVLQIQCEGYSIPLIKTLSCKCALCDAARLIASGHVELADSAERVSGISVYVNDKQVSETDSSGQFDFNLPSQSARVPVTFKDERTNRQILDTTVTFITTPYVDLYENITVLPSPQPIMVVNGNERIITLGTFADLLIPSASFVDSSGKPYTEPVSVYIKTIDLQDVGEVAGVPGNFQTTNENGDLTSLRPFGIFSLAFSDSNGNALRSVAPLTVFSDTEQIQPLSNNVVFIRYFNPKTGFWELLDTFSRSQRKRRRRQQQLYEASVTITDNLIWLIIDVLDTTNNCWAKVVPYGNNILSGSPVYGSKVTAKTLVGTPPYYRIYEDVVSNNGACLQIGCPDNDEENTVYLSASIGAAQLFPADIPQPGFSLPQSVIDDLNYNIFSNTVSSSIEIKVDQSDVFPDGPIFRPDDEQLCRESSGQHFQFFAGSSTASWSSWETWGPCSVTCGQGFQDRLRRCNTGILCVEGGISEKRPCIEASCGTWLNWGTWNACSMTCGNGVQNRQRQCNLPNGCDGGSSQQQSCNIRECGSEFSSWGPWTTCSATCEVGEHMRTRQCLLDQCDGDVQETQLCNNGRCPSLGQWGPWGTCSVTCGLGQRIRSREVGESLVQEKAECSVNCNSALWTTWTSWSQCTGACESTAQRVRTRNCVIQGDAVCEGDVSREIQSCSLRCPTLSDWTSWSACDSSCESGTAAAGSQVRQRTCMDPDSIGGGCMGETMEMQECFRLCVSWSAWRDWGACSRSCGDGLQTRVRVCSDPFNTGQWCGGVTPSEVQDCNSGECPPPDPAWARWSTWSSCGASCGGSMQQRSRQCTDPVTTDALLCIGQESETRNCNTFICPACNGLCTNGGIRNSDCVCACSSSQLNGRVMDSHNVPVDGAQIARAERPDVALATSGSDGMFSVSGICAQVQSMVVTRPMFTTFTGNTEPQSDGVTSTIGAVIERMELPYITEHPSTKMRLTGEDVAFCCMATGIPSPIKYEWFKNDNIIESEGANSDKLTLTSLVRDDTGVYSCRVHNDAGCIFSDSAELTVTDSAMKCNEPVTKIIPLPVDCEQPGTNRNEYNVRECEPIECQGTKIDQTSCMDMDDEIYCCQPTMKETVTLSCQGYTLPVSRIVSCGCAKCLQRPSKITGSVQNSNTGDPLSLIKVTYKDNIIFTDNTGSFSFELNPVSRAAVLFQDPFNKVIDTSIVVRVNRGANVFRVIKMKPKPTPMTIDSTQENSIPLVSSAGNTPVAELMIAPGTIFDQAGDVYEGNVMLSVFNMDMRDVSDAEIAPSDFMAVDEDGRPADLLSHGVFAIGLEDMNQNPLTIGGSSMVVVNQNMIPECVFDDAGFCNTKLWVLNTKTGLWEMESELTRPESGGRKRQIVGLVGSIIFSCVGYCYYNIDSFWDTSEECWGHVIGYESNSFQTELTDIVVTGLIYDGMVYRRTRTDLAWGPSQTQTNTGVCIPLGCDDSNIADPPGSRKYTSYISATHNGISLTPFDPDQASVLGLSLLDFKLAADATCLGYDVDDAGPVNSAIVFSPTELCGSGAIHPDEDANTSPSGTCYNAVKANTHFQFYRDGIGLLCNTVESQAINPTATTLCTFYPGDIANSFVRYYCFVGVKIIAPASITQARVVATSELLDILYNGQMALNMGNGKFFGRREVLASSNNGQFDVCMEYKCGGAARNGITILGNAYTKVTLTVEVNDPNLVCTADINVNILYPVIQCDGTPFASQTGLSTPLCFIDPQSYESTSGSGTTTRVFTQDSNAAGTAGNCLGDTYSRQDTGTGNCEASGTALGTFYQAFTITCA